MCRSSDRILFGRCCNQEIKASQVQINEGTAMTYIASMMVDIIGKCPALTRTTLAVLGDHCLNEESLEEYNRNICFEEQRFFFKNRSNNLRCQ